MAKLRNGSEWDSNPSSLNCESGNLPLSYRAVLVTKQIMGIHCNEVDLFVNSVIFTKLHKNRIRPQSSAIAPASAVSPE